MILDASAILAVLLGEPCAERAIEHIGVSDVVAAGAPTLVETAMVLSNRLKRDGRPLLNAFVQGADLEIIPLSQEHVEIAIDAFQRFGKGRHSAALNFGDCLTYAVAHIAQLPLLCTGTDFPKTDLKTVRLK
jgi:ribonuclease VapC